MPILFAVLGIKLYREELTPKIMEMVDVHFAVVCWASARGSGNDFPCNREQNVSQTVSVATQTSPFATQYWHSVSTK